MKEQMKIEQQEVFKPKIDFIIDEKIDIEYFELFWHEYGVAMHTELNYLTEDLENNKITKEDGLVEAEKFIKNFHANNREQLEIGKNEVIAKWREVEQLFYTKVDKILKGWPWPKGVYTGVATTIRIYPRFIAKKEFAFPAIDQHQQANRVIAHEMLHFIVYDYLENKFNLKPSEARDEDNTFWQFTENFNTVLENSDFWKEFMNGNSAQPKPECMEQYERMKKLWDNGITEIDDLAKEILTIKK